MQALPLTHWILNRTTMHGDPDDAGMPGDRDAPRSGTAPIPDADLPGELRDVFEDPHGRSALVYLSRAGGPVDLDELSRGVVGLITDEPPDEVGGTSLRQVRTWLHHGHLPVLDDHGVVAYDFETGRVSLLDRDVVPGEADSLPPDHFPGG